MWICLNDAFLSIVADENSTDNLLVRARVKGHIEAFLGFAQKRFKLKVAETPDADYRYRCRVPTGLVSNLLAAQVEDIDYPNFKDSVKDRDLRSVYGEFWGVMRLLQKRMINPSKKKK